MKDRLTGYSALAAIDATCDCLRRNSRAIFSAYAPWAIPFLMAVLLLVHAVDTGDMVLLFLTAPLLAIAGYCRWIGALAASAATTTALTSVPSPPLRKGMIPYFRARFRFHPVLAGPVALDQNASTKPLERLRQLRKANKNFFFRVNFCMAIFTLVLVIQLCALEFFLFELVFPYLLGLEERMWYVVAFSPIWWIGIGALMLISLEIFLTVLGTVAYHRLAARWIGADLLRRLGQEAA